MTQTTQNRRFILKNRPVGEPKLEDFELVEHALSAPGEGEVLARTIYLSLDPYMRGRMSAAKSYADPVELGALMVGGTVSEVLESRDPRLRPGDLVQGEGGWQTHALMRADRLRKLDPAAAPISYALGILGMPGMTAYAALLDIGQPKAGETIVVSAAAGAVGSVAGQIGKLCGARVVGVAGTEAKCAYVVEELGFDACINRHAENLPGALQAAAPDGIDVYFDNTAGLVLEAVMQAINLHARIALVGLIAQYNSGNPAGPNLAPLLVKRASIKGFLVSDYAHRARDFARDVGGWLRAGKLTYREDRVAGLENAPRAFIGLLRGENFGKAIVEVGPDPSAR